MLKGLGLDAVRQAGSGSAPLPPELIRWYRRLGLKLYEGYAMTEDNSYSHSSNEQHAEPGWVGAALPGVKVRISPEGEILIKSPGQFSGYYKQPELTAESFTEDGFFRTGDRGELRADGLLKITGRTKELFKTAKGKYVAPAPIESLLLAHPMIELAMVSGVGQPAAYALVVLAEDLRPRTGDPAVRAQVEQELAALLKQVNAKVADYEKLQMIVIAREPWTIENGCLTPTMKIKRSRIEEGAAAAGRGLVRRQQAGGVGVSGPDARPVLQAQRHGGDRIAEALQAQGVTEVFTLCGGHISPILSASKARGIRIVDVRDEVTAVFAADAQRAAVGPARRGRRHRRPRHHQHHHRAEERAAGAVAGGADRRRRAHRAAGPRRAAGHRPAPSRRAACQALPEDAARARPGPGRGRGLCAGAVGRARPGVHRMPGGPAVRRSLDPPVVCRRGRQRHQPARPRAALVPEPACAAHVRRQPGDHRAATAAGEHTAWPATARCTRRWPRCARASGR